MYSDTVSHPYLFSTFIGTGLPADTYNGNFYVNQGSINSYVESSMDKSGQTKIDWGIYNLNLSASDVFSAIRSSSKNDDEILIQQIFSGDNIFTLI